MNSQNNQLKNILAVLFTTLWGGFAGAAPTAVRGGIPGVEQPQAGTFEESVILVKPKPGLTSARFNGLLASFGAVSGPVAKATGIHAIHVPAGLELATVQRLQASPLIEFAEINQRLAPSALTNDPYASYAWHFDKLGVAASWMQSTGTNIKVAVVDSGVNATHPDLAGQVLSGKHILNGSTNTADISGHGTMVAGVIAALTNNAKGVPAIAHGTKILPVRITDDPKGYAYYSNIAKAITWAADNGARVINVSYQAWTSKTVATAAQYAKNKRAVVVLSAGNDATLYSTQPNTAYLVVGATDQNDKRASYSSYGPMLDLWAPGTSIPTTNNAGGYSLFTGTSAASPVTASVIAQIFSANAALTPDDARGILFKTVDRPTGDPILASYGKGRVNAQKAVNEAWLSVPDKTLPRVSFSSPKASSTVKGLVNLGVAATDNRGVAKVEVYVDNVLLGTDLVSPYAFVWDASKTYNAKPVLKAKAYDAAGNVATFSITVLNTTP